MVEATYEQTNGRVIIGAGMSEQFSVNIGLRQGSALSPAIHCGDGANQQESIYERHKSETPICRRSGHSSGRQGAKTINVFRACLGAQLTICAQK